MNLKTLLNRFAADESGAVTVDWVVLTAGLVGLAAIIGTSVATGVQNAGTTIQNGMENADQFAPGGSTTTDTTTNGG